MKKNIVLYIVGMALLGLAVLSTSSDPLDAQGKKPRFSQLDFDDTPRNQPRNNEPSVNQNLSPLEMLIQQAQGANGDNKAQDSAGQVPPTPNVDQRNGNQESNTQQSGQHQRR